MALPLGLLNRTVTIKRRRSLGRDSLNNPDYGTPTVGDGWATIYEGLPCRLAFSSKTTNFAKEGERINPIGTMYFNSGYTLEAEDRVITDDATEYNVISVVKGQTFGPVVDHYEAILQLP